MEHKNVEKLISLVRERPLIYGLRPKRGKKKHQKLLDGLWSEIALEMNRPIRECKLKWTTLRNCYARLLREERCHKVKKRHWHLRNEMSFLRGHIQPYTESRGRSSRRNVSARPKISTVVSTENYSAEENSYSSIVPPCKSPSANDVSQIPSTEDIVSDNNEQIHNWENLPEENEVPSYCPVVKLSPISLLERSSEYAEDITYHQAKHKEEQSESNSLFLRSLLTDVNKLSDRKQRVFKRKVLELLEFLFDEDENDTENHYRQCHTTRSNHSTHTHQQHISSVTEKFIQKPEPTSP